MVGSRVEKAWKSPPDLNVWITSSDAGAGVAVVERWLVGREWPGFHSSDLIQILQAWGSSSRNVWVFLHRKA